MSTVEEAKDLVPLREFFVGVDSDGCAFDSMEIKHKECFCPAYVNHFGLQGVSKYAREAWDFVNLYSRSRGANRFIAVLKALELLRTHPEVTRRGFQVPELKRLAAWVAGETRLGNPALARATERTESAELMRTLDWSVDVNAAIEKIVRDVPPFPHCRESLHAISARADLVVVSQTPADALEREWAEHGIQRYARLICGQEIGTKKEHLKMLTEGKYPRGQVLMVGDAPGDHEAAASAGALFYPIVPGGEVESWKRFHDEALGRFLAGTFAGAYERELLDGFNRSLPEKAPWEP